MKNVIKNIKNSKGFVSIESILVIGVIIVLAGIILFFLNGKAQSVSNSSGGQIAKAEKAQTDSGKFTPTSVIPPVTP